MQWTSCLCVLVRSTHTGVQVWTTAALSSSFYLFKVKRCKLWVLGLLMAKLSRRPTWRTEENVPWQN